MTFCECGTSQSSDYLTCISMTRTPFQSRSDKHRRLGSGCRCAGQSSRCSARWSPPGAWSSSASPGSPSSCGAPPWWRTSRYMNCEYPAQTYSSTHPVQQFLSIETNAKFAHKYLSPLELCQGLVKAPCVQ